MEKEIKIPKIEFSVRYSEKVKKSELFQISNSKDAYQAFQKIFDSDVIDWIEEAFLLCLSRSNKVVGYFKISQGGTCGTVLDPKVIFSLALKLPTSAIVIAHNHPSGNLKPSMADRAITKKMVNAGALLDISVLDSMIITSEGYYSFADNSEL
ncbi:JAB domain-containing protein [Jiulongibacter sp. NS-SX5]|uniref:JAB domain-containing protein n=1 Tax=Jiulongibacter sp. NS-SX5 TaxID=3463854 RepID=UPI004058E97B